MTIISASRLLILMLLSSLAAASASRELFQLPSDFYDDRCHPCLARDEYFVHVLGPVSSLWPQIRSAMEQAQRDTKVELTFQEFGESKEGVLAMAEVLRERTRDGGREAIILTIPELDAESREVLEAAIADAVQAGIPIFGYGSGYQKSQELGVLGHAAQDEFVAGNVVAEELLKIVHDKVEQTMNLGDDKHRRNLQQQVNWTHSERALFVTTASNSQSKIQERFEGLRYAFGEYTDSISYNTSVSSVDIQIEIDLQGAVLTEEGLAIDSRTTTTFQHMSPQTILEECPYDILILDGDEATDEVMQALEQSPCNQTLVAIFSDFALIKPTRSRLLQNTIAFAATPQIYLQSVFAVVMASVYTSTGKKLALPMDSDGIFLSGPKLIAPDKYGKLPEDSITNCETYAFPTCNPDSLTGEEPFPSSLLPQPLQSTSISESRVCNEQGCIKRDKIRLAGILHGTTTSLFWKPIFASAHQTALDLGVSLEMEPWEPQESRDIMWAKMSFKIRTYCEAGYDGIIVTLPNEAILDAVRFCQLLRVPVVSINSGADFSQQLGLMAHIGQMEYNAGYGGGQRLIKEGIKEGFCLSHSLGSVAMAERCRGFEAALADSGEVAYRGVVQVGGDDKTRTRVNVEAAVAEHSSDDSWEGIGFLTLSTSAVDGVLEVLKDHEGAVMGTFDVGERIYGPLAEGRLLFGIDQQALLQGIMPVYLLTYAAYTKQSLASKLIETGPHFLDAEPSEGQEVCENNYFAVCQEIPEEEMNELPMALVAMGYCAVALTLVSCVLCVAWTLYYRSKSELVRVGQPPFLIALVVGIAISTLSILFMSAETEYPTLKSEFTGLLTEEENPAIAMANASCMMVYWLQGIGNAIAFVSLFSKIWKIKMIFKAGERFRRIQVGTKDILPYAAPLVAVVLGILIAWQVVDPFLWTRTVELTDEDGLALESYGECSSDTGWYFLLSLLFFQLVYLTYALVLCWQTKQIPSDFAESNWVSLCVICIFQVSVLAIPIAAMVRDDTVAFYFVRACAAFLQNFTVLCLMFIPKMWRVAQGNDQLTMIRQTSMPATSYQSSENLSGRSQQRFSIASARQGSANPWKRDSQASSVSSLRQTSLRQAREGRSTLTVESMASTAPGASVQLSGLSGHSRVSNHSMGLVDGTQHDPIEEEEVNEDESDSRAAEPTLQEQSKQKSISSEQIDFHT